MKHISFKDAVFAAILALLFTAGIRSADAAWTQPATNQPSADTQMKPITLGNDVNSKSGGLGVNSGGGASSVGLQVAQGRVVIGTNANIGPAMVLGMEGKLLASEYCDNQGLNCIAPGQFNSIGKFDIPIGAIAPFLSACPSPSWDQYAPLTAQYPRGNDTSLGQSTGDAMYHSHGPWPYTIPYDNATVKGDPSGSSFPRYKTNFTTPGLPSYNVMYCKKIQ